MIGVSVCSQLLFMFHLGIFTSKRRQIRLKGAEGIQLAPTTGVSVFPTDRPTERPGHTQIALARPTTTKNAEPARCAGRSV